MLAAFNGKTDCARLLLSEAGKQTTKEYNDFPPGTTALMMAAHRNRPEVVKLLLPYEQGLKDSKGHTAQWHANNGVSWGGDFTQVRKLLENEGTTRLPPPSNPAELLKLRKNFNELTTENESLKKDLASSKNAHNKTERKLSQMEKDLEELKAVNTSLRAGIDERDEHIRILEEALVESEQLQQRLASTEEDRRLARNEASEARALAEQLQKQVEEGKNEQKKNAALIDSPNTSVSSSEQQPS
ncbi:Ankyrin repeat protein 1 [Giardia muris]|uniref:Ankyrin repeat protein 1 n=1 Tax=Giardia muris TaxID=5742 RepID=A0A4Z1SQH8_GIAMU|nr:Ankyrin repeat protein 1 [Giardia muris]|eukprot:TNJ27930.1 Ankyrin repeat protein 1 [Giardia muris]